MKFSAVILVSNDNFFSNYGAYFNIGLQIAVSLCLPIVAGHWLDTYFGTSPWLLLAGCLAGLLSAGIVVYRLWKKIKNRS